MFTLLFVILLFVVIGKILILAIKAAWGISKIILSVIVFPIVLIALVLTGFLSVAMVILLTVGIIAFVGGLVIG